ncbi:2-hydroxyacid dehydrogenase [Leucobacter sp. GX24907]
MSDLVVSLPDDELFELMGEVPGVEFVSWDLTGEAPRSSFDIVVPPYWGGTAQLARIADVETRLVQWQSIGFNGVADSLPEGVPFANASTVHESGTAELAVTLALAAQRNIPGFVQDQARGFWNLHTRPSLADRRCLIVGYGGVSKAIEARLAPFETEITRVASRAREDRNLAGDTVHVHGIDELDELLPSTEIVLLAVPLTDATRGLFGAAELAALPDDALIVNVARGPVVDTDALLAELEAGRLRAALDVTDPEPLPEDHPLWHAPGVLITPHVGGDSSAMLPRLRALLLRQIEHVRAGERPENLVLGEWAE